MGPCITRSEPLQIPTLLPPICRPAPHPASHPVPHLELRQDHPKVHPRVGEHFQVGGTARTKARGWGMSLGGFKGQPGQGTGWVTPGREADRTRSGGPHRPRGEFGFCPQFQKKPLEDLEQERGCVSLPLIKIPVGGGRGVGQGRGVKELQPTLSSHFSKVLPPSRPLPDSRGTGGGG